MATTTDFRRHSPAPIVRTLKNIDINKRRNVSVSLTKSEVIFSLLYMELQICATNAKYINCYGVLNGTCHSY